MAGPSLSSHGTVAVICLRALTRRGVVGLSQFSYAMMYLLSVLHETVILKLRLRNQFNAPSDFTTISELLQGQSDGAIGSAGFAAKLSEDDGVV